MKHIGTDTRRIVASGKVKGSHATSEKRQVHIEIAGYETAARKARKAAKKELAAYIG